MMTFWLASVAFGLGLFILWFRELFFLPLFLVTAHLAILAAFVGAARSWRDAFNPLCVILAIGFVRFDLPGLMLMWGADPQSEFLLAMRLSATDWQLGHVLALTGLLGIVLGWVMAPGRSGRMTALEFGLSRGAGYAAVAAMTVGFAALLMFVGSNTSIVDTLVSGGFRGTTVQVGTGKFFFLSFLLISGSVVLSGFLLPKRSGFKWTFLVPVILAMLSFWGLGGRGRAIVPLLAGLLLLWYFRREQKRWDRLSLRFVSLVVVVAVPLFIWTGYFGELYRGGLGLGGFLESFSLPGLRRYVQESIFLDIGHLHPLAGAVVLEPGLLAGTTFVHRLLWPLSQILELSGRSSGIVVVERLVGLGRQRWGLGISLMGDAYVNFGVPGIPIVMGLFGLLVKMLYVGFRRGSIHSAVYVLAAIHSAGMLINGIDLWIYALIILASTLFVISMGRLLTHKGPVRGYAGSGNYAPGDQRRILQDALDNGRVG
ncbi:MAG TPA: O-antigen polymerase [Nitrospiraceae bacterium]|nr:O-antigen polymerase [Nitrospiraceae bacterium]